MICRKKSVGWRESVLRIFYAGDSVVGNTSCKQTVFRRFCDKIAVFHQGEIVQIGAYEELLTDEGGKYYELWNEQAQYYIERAA